jgi:hypothetical protein
MRRERLLSFKTHVLFPKEVELLYGQASNISHVVVTSLRDASNLQTVQAETSQSAVKLIRTLENLTDTTYAELARINVSAFEVQRQLSIQQDPLVTWRHLVLQIFSIFGQGGSFHRAWVDVIHSYSGDLSAVQHFTSFRFLLSVISCLWVIFRVLVSAVMASRIKVSYVVHSS